MFAAFMSQSQNPSDTQALLQSMLQKLKLQQERESQTTLKQPALYPAASSEDVEREASLHQKVKSSPVSHPTKNGGPFNVPLSPVDSSGGLEDGEVDGGVTSSPSHKHNTRAEDSRPAVSSIGVERPLLVNSHKDTAITSDETNDSQGQNRDQDQPFTPRVYMWSQTNSNSNTGEQGNKVLHVGNGGFTAVAANSSNNNHRSEQSSERKARRWTLKIKERWRYRRGSLGKKGKEDGGQEEEKSAQIVDVPAENPFSSFHKDGEEMLSPSESPSAQAEDSTADGPTRSAADFDFGLGSFSLLDEITMGQEWAKFINPNLTATATASGEQQSSNKGPWNHQHTNHSLGMVRQEGGNMWSFKSAESSQATAQQLADASSPVSMDITEGKPSQISGEREGDQSEPMEDGLTQSAPRPADVSLDGYSRPLGFAKTGDSLYGSMQRSRFQLNRKRQYQARAEPMDDGEDAVRLAISRCAMDESESTRSSVTTNSHPPPESTASSNLSAPLAPAPRGILKHSMPWDLDAAMESQSKRRRLEENRHVHFSEEVVVIESPVLHFTDSEEEEEEEEKEEEEDTEQEAEVEQAPVEEAAPARRHALPNWILALKRKNIGKKHG